MRKAIVVLLGIVLPVVGLADAGLAQSAVSVQGTIQAVDCQGQTLVLNGAGGSNTLAATASTAVSANSGSVPFCALQQYVGDSATAWLSPAGNEFQLTRIDVVGPVTRASAPAPAVHSGPSTLGIVLGALAVGALGYVIGRSSAPPPQPVYQPYAPGYQPYAPAYQPYQSGYRYDPRDPRFRYYQQCWSRGGYYQCQPRQESPDNH